MKYRGIIASVLMMAVFLVGCTSDTAAAKKIAEYYESLTDWKTNVSMTVDLGEQTAKFRLAWDVSSDASHITVLEPQEIAGLGVTVSADGQEVTYEDAAIVLPRSDGTAAPMPTEALMLIHGFWQNGIRASETTEKQGDATLVRIDYRSVDETQPITVTSWFDAVDLRPAASEVFYDGVRVIACTFEEFAPQKDMKNDPNKEGN